MCECVCEGGCVHVCGARLSVKNAGDEERLDQKLRSRRGPGASWPPQRRCWAAVHAPPVFEQKVHDWERQKIRRRMLKVKQLQQSCMAVTAAAVQAQNLSDLLELLGCMAQVTVSAHTCPPVWGRGGSDGSNQKKIRLTFDLCPSSD